MDLGLRDRVVLVTGGAGGIGTAIVRALAAEGAVPVVHYRRSAEAAESLASDTGGVALPADLRDPEAAETLVGEVVARFGRLDGCVANAGVWPRQAVPVWEMDPARWEETLRANLGVTFATARAYLAHAAAMGNGGSLVMIGSTAGSFGEADHADYAAAKGAIMSGLLLSLKNEGARIGVRVNAVAPGWTVTPMIGDKGLDDEHVERVTSTMALKKLGKPEDVAAQVIVLLSDEVSGHVTGQVVTVAGGMEGRRLD